MTDTAGLHLVSDDEPEADPVLEPVGPQVFVRSISAPPGAPWDQARAATLEARLGAPLPLGEVVYQLQRLDSWSPGRSARFAAAYVRAREVKDELATTVEVDGRRLKVRFVSAGKRRGQAQQLGLLAAVAIAACLAAGFAVTTALIDRAQISSRLDGLEDDAGARLRAAEHLEHLKDQTRALNMAHVRGQTIGDYLKDLDWAASAKSPAAHIDSIRWERGIMAVQVRGDAAPFTATDRTVIRAKKPLKPGVWLWGVGPSSLASATRAPTPASSNVGP